MTLPIGSFSRVCLDCPSRGVSKRRLSWPLQGSRPIDIQVSVRAEDWLDLKVEFSYGDTVVDGRDVPKSWRKGERFHRLEDGTLVHLPEEWLRRHRVVHEELEAIRDANDGRIPHYAAPMLEDLLGEVDGDISAWEVYRGAGGRGDRDVPRSGSRPT